MAHNDNRTLETQQAIQAYEERLNECGRELRSSTLRSIRLYDYPNMKGLPDYGIGSLKPETEEYCRGICEKIGMSYEELKDDYAAGHQVIQARQRNPINSQLIKKGVCPINRLDESFTAYVQGAVGMKRRLKAERAEKISQELSSVN